MNTTFTIPIDPESRIQLPPDWAKALGMSGMVTLERTDNGILVRPCPQYTWDDIFASRLTVRPADAAAAPDVTEIDGDDLLF